MRNKIYLVVSLVLISLFFSKPVSATDNRLYFDPESITLTIGEQKDIKLHMNPNGTSIIGVDTIIVFDPNIISITDIKSLNVFSTTTGKNISNTDGIAKFSLSNSYGSYQTGEADIALITIQGKQVSSFSKLYLDYSLGKTTDTNLVTTHGQDILTSVGSLEITVNNASQSPSSTPSPGPSGTPGPNPSPTAYIYSSPTPNLNYLTPTPYKNNNNNDKDNNKDKGKNQSSGNNTDKITNQKSIGNILGITEDSSDGTNTSRVNYLPLLAYVLILGYVFIKGFRFAKAKLPLFRKKDIYLTLSLMVAVMIPLLMIPKLVQAQDTPTPTPTSIPANPTATTIPATPTPTATPTNAPNPTTTLTPSPTQQPSASTVPTKVVKKSTITPTRYPTLTPTVTPTPELTETPTPTPGKGSSIPTNILPIIFILGGILFIGGAVVANKKAKRS